MLKLFNPLLILLLIIFVYISTSHLLDDPQVWPDEALYGDIAKNLMLENRLGTDLLKGLIKSVENHAYWIPPFYMHSASFWFKFFGFSIENMRYFSVFLATLVLIFFYLINKSFVKLKNRSLNNYLPFLPVVLLAVDPTFLKASRLGRPEILVLFLVTISFFLYSKTFNKSPKQTLLIALTGFFLGLAFTTHLLAIAFLLPFSLHLLFSLWKKHVTLKQFSCYLIALSLPVIIWIISILPTYDLLLNQLSIISESRGFTIPWYINVSTFPLFLKLNYFIYIAISLLFLFFTFKNPKPKNILLSLLIISIWIFITLGEIFWYTVYPLPFVYLALLILTTELFNSTSKSKLSKTLKIASISIVLLYSFSGSLEYTRASGFSSPNNYQTFRNQITENIPPGKTVFLSSIPDAYFTFDSGRNTLYQYPAFFLDTGDFQKVLDKTDYIIFNGYYSPEQISLFLDQYMAKNLESVQEIKVPYQILIVKLKSYDLRQ